jgi:Glycosyltransferase family 9 (heptosyltransferase)
MTLATSAHGLGDAVILSDLPRAGHQQDRKMTVFAPSEHFQTVMSFNPFYAPGLLPFCAFADLLYHAFDLGNGHLIQRLRRAYGLPVEDKPRGSIEVPGRVARRRVVLHFEAGTHAEWQRRHVHPDARKLSAKSTEEIERFIARCPDIDFVEIGAQPSGIVGVVSRTGLPLADSIRLLARAEYFIGIMSGPMHLAAALGLRLICITNFPRAEQICLPTLKDIDQIESEWFYPQSVILHQDGEGRFVARLTADNLQRAFDGELYPYWSDRYLSLVHEALRDRNYSRPKWRPPGKKRGVSADARHVVRRAGRS